MKHRLLVVEDDAAMRVLLAEGLGRRGFDVQAHANAADAREAATREEFDLVLTDLHMPGTDGVELCRHLTEARPDVPVVVLTAFGSVETAVKAMRSGAYDFVTKPADLDALALTCERAVGHRLLNQELRRLRRTVAAGVDHGAGESPAICEVYALLDRIADSDASVLVTGESGTGKELAARALHQRSKRRAGPFIAVNCAAMPEPLLESELFGHVKGAFTDAKSAKTGLFVEASGGTLLLDEVGELPLGLQPKLLRALQERRVRPVGSTTEVPFAARVVTATNRDLELEVSQGRFREDLYFRLNVIELHLPPLRARGNDVLLLAQQFTRAFASQSGKTVEGMAPGFADKLLRYPWPGNVRELQNCIERAVAVTQLSSLGVDDLPERIRRYTSDPGAGQPVEGPKLVSLAEVERRHILGVLETLGGNRSQAARVLGLDRKTLYRKLKDYEAVP